MPLVTMSDNQDDVALITLYRVEVEGAGEAFRFTNVGHYADEHVRCLFSHENARDDGWIGFLQNLIKSSYHYRGESRNYDIISKKVSDDMFPWHRERVITCRQMSSEIDTHTVYSLVSRHAPLDEEGQELTDEMIADMVADCEEACRISAEKTYRIHHHYDIGNQTVFVERYEGGIDGKRAVLYCEFMCEEWFGPNMDMSNLAYAALLEMFYGFRHVASDYGDGFTDVDLYSDREKSIGDSDKIKSDASLHRDGLREAMARFVHRV